MLTANAHVPASTMTAPAASRGTRALTKLPAAALLAPISPDTSVIVPRRSVQNRAAVGGMTSCATTSNSPTLGIPITVTATTRAVSNKSNRPTGQPKAAA